MNHIDLFSGIGGFALSAKWTWCDDYVNLGHSEIEKFPCKVYHKHFPESKCLGDITKIDWSEYAGRVDLLTGGTPCQPFSVAGKRGKTQDVRFLWPELMRSVHAIRPRIVFAENVSGIDDETEMVLDSMCLDLEGEGYEVAPAFEIPACGVNSPQFRYRTWLVAHSNSKRRRQQKKKSLFTGRSAAELCSWWSVEPTVGRVAYGVRDQLDRGRAIGNAIVPQVAQVIMEAIKEVDK